MNAAASWEAADYAVAQTIVTAPDGSLLTQLGCRALGAKPADRCVAPML